jgi:arylsulfatase
MVTPGAWTDQVAHIIDLTPTILEAAEAQHPAQFAGHSVLPLEGKSLVSTFASSAPVVDVPRQLGFEHETNRAWIDGDFKLVVRHENNDKPELYDLSKDPSELDDLSATMPDRLTQMIAAWNAWATRVGVPAARQLPTP